ncbi:hypothetical protein ACAG26_20310 [Mycobacterium sp. pUA109]|uniref:hypothetical protein n=1 Tax=Mycobacterium sp. pUA109 TaxID=3238982 RepID=UPI00351B615E
MSLAQTVVAPEEVQAFVDDPAEFFGRSWQAMQDVDRERLEGLQLEAIRLRFAQLRDRIPTLTRLADELGVSEIVDWDGAVALLFQHSVYKSYPVVLLERNRFRDLTRWLDRLTVRDLSRVDVEGCDSIDSWIDALDTQTDLRVCHSSGTAGTMSFLPRTLGEWDRMYKGIRCGMFQLSDPDARDDHPGEYFNLVWPLYRHARSAIGLLPDMALDRVMGSPERVHALREGRLSADSMFLAGRLRAAAARGELDRLDINPALKRRRAEFEAEQRELFEGVPRFIKQKVAELAGQRVWILGTWNVLYDMAKQGLSSGLENVFDSGSLVTTGGGAKGQIVPDDWEDVVRRFVGVGRLQHIYGMSEMTAMHKLCEAQRYHFDPWVVPFVLDPDTGTVLPRSGRQTGRMAIFDLLPDTYWGGFITGDEVHIDWRPCSCGRTTPHIARQIERYSEQRGGDDKITCAASDDAHAAALEFLNERLV